MATPLGGTSGDANLSAILAETTLEKQLVAMTSYAQQQQTAYNELETTTNAINLVAVQPTSTQVQLNVKGAVDDTAISQPFWDAAVVANVTALPPLGAGGETGDAATIAAIPSLEGQIAYVAAQLHLQEAAYNAAQPDATTQVNHVQVSVDYDTNLFDVKAAFDQSTAGLVSLVEAVPY